MPVRTDLGPRSLYLAGSHVSNRWEGSMTWSSTLTILGSSATERPAPPQGLDLHVVVAEHLSEHDVVVLPDVGRLLGQRQLLADHLDGRGQLVAARRSLGIHWKRSLN